jgi:hypothetical protein
MPATTPRPKDSPGKRQNDEDRARFVKCDLNAEQKILLKTFGEELEDADLLKWLDDRVMNGHTISVKSVEVGWMCALTGMRESSGHVGKCLTARASTPTRALVSCMYKDNHVLQGLWPATGSLEELDY